MLVDGFYCDPVVEPRVGSVVCFWKVDRGIATVNVGHRAVSDGWFGYAVIQARPSPPDGTTITCTRWRLHVSTDSML
jgi:hypothetical protein